MINESEIEKGETKFPYYRAKGDCSTCKKNPQDSTCTERMFFVCCSSEYNGEPKIFRAVRTTSAFPDWYEPKGDK